ncbi:unnamed protein product [Hydatigera taeniaeformis]|uniref:Vesicular, overexpressed in cancer, prosurvival protein 1 n=1 Tax=Hydatigena taeniaeformis TaxID=6205 RepID=A0A0R3WP77_HYDTA|nr:unnamed protein product [Hydatigera taeniaeformis]
MTPWTSWSVCKVDPLSGRCQQTRTRTCFNVTAIEETALPPSGAAFPDSTPTCPQSVLESRFCESSECAIGEALQTTNEKKNGPSSTNIREIMFYVGLVAAFTVTALIIFTVCRLNRRKPSSFSNPLCPRRFSTRQNEYGKSMTILRNSRSSTYDMPPITNGVGSLPRQLKAGEGTPIGLPDYPANNASPRHLVQSQTQRPVSGTEAGNTYNQPYSPIPTMFAPLSPSFPNGRPFQSPKFNYLVKESPSFGSTGNSVPYSPLPGGGGYTNPPPPGQPIPPLPPPHMVPSRSSASSSTGGVQTQSPQQQQPIYLSPSSTPNTGLGGAEGGDDSSSAFYHEIGTAAESIFPLIPPLPVAAGETGSTTWANIGSVGGVVNLPESG